MLLLNHINDQSGSTIRFSEQMTRHNLLSPLAADASAVDSTQYQSARTIPKTENMLTHDGKHAQHDNE
jgi:hypothetical protein